MDAAVAAGPLAWRATALAPALAPALALTLAPALALALALSRGCCWPFVRCLLCAESAHITTVGHRHPTADGLLRQAPYCTLLCADCLLCAESAHRRPQAPTRRMSMEAGQRGQGGELRRASISERRV